MTHSPLCAAILSVSMFSMVACGGGDKRANTGEPLPAQCPPGQKFDGRVCQAGQTQPAPSATPSALPNPTPAPSTLVMSARGPAAQPIDVSAAAMVTVALAPLATQSAPGAKAVGNPIAASFQQGQIVESMIQMKPGKCYTIVGVGVPTIQNLDIELAPLALMPGIAPMVVAADKTQTSTAVVAPAPNCFKWAFTVPGTMNAVMRVSAGQGIAAMQVYEN